MLEVFPFHVRGSNNRGVVSRGIVDFYKVFVKFGPAVNNALPKVDIGLRGKGFVAVVGSCINVVAVRSYMVDEAI